MNPDDLTTLLSVIANNPGTIIAATIPQVAAFAAAWLRIERRITRLETLIDLYFSRETQPHQSQEEPKALSPHWPRRTRQ